MTTIKSEYQATIRRGVAVVVETRNGREIGVYGFATVADASAHVLRLRGFDPSTN